MVSKPQASAPPPAPAIDPAQIQTAAQSMIQKAAQPGAQALGTLAQLQLRRAARMTDAANAVRKQQVPDSPDAAALDSAAKAAADFKAQVDAQAARFKCMPKPRPTEWVVFGTVTDANGNPAAGLTMRVFDRDRKYDDMLGETETNEYGDFSTVYHERDFKETGENLPDLYVMVSDAKGKTVYSSRDSVRYEAGKSEYFAIQLGEQKTKMQKK